MGAEAGKIEEPGNRDASKIRQVDRFLITLSVWALPPNLVQPSATKELPPL